MARPARRSWFVEPASVGALNVGSHKTCLAAFRRALAALGRGTSYVRTWPVDQIQIGAGLSDADAAPWTRVGAGRETRAQR
jgi:hypothetical protein